MQGVRQRARETRPVEVSGENALSTYGRIRGGVPSLRKKDSKEFAGTKEGEINRLINALKERGVGKAENFLPLINF